MPKLIFVMGMPGVRKRSIVRALVVRPGLDCEYAVPMTTRPEPADLSGYVTFPYHFCSEEHFRYKLDRGWFLEYIKVDHGDGPVYCGTMKYQLEEGLKKGKSVIVGIDTFDGSIIRHHWPEALSIFITLPGRSVEMHGDPSKYDLVVENRNPRATVRLLSLFLRKHLTPVAAPEFAKAAE